MSEAVKSKISIVVLCASDRAPASPITILVESSFGRHRLSRLVICRGFGVF